jgi:probable addiction module antidote protein
MKKQKAKLTDFFETIAGEINTPKKMRQYIKGVNKAYDLTKDPDVILTALKIIALAKGNVSELARESKVERRSIYNMFQKGSNPTLKNLVAVSKNLGLSLHLCPVP